MKLRKGRLESVTEATRHSALRQEILRRRGTTKQHHLLADELAECAHEKASKSGICLVCMRAQRRQLAGAIEAYLKPNLDDWMAVSAIPSDRYSPGQLEIDFAAMTKAMRVALIRAGLGGLEIIGGIDISFNVNSWKPPHWEPHWQLQWYFLIRCRDLSWLKSKLKELFPASKFVLRPLQSRKVTDPFKAATYLFKSRFFKRITVYDAKLKKRNGSPRKRQTLKRELTSLQTRELLLALHDQPARSRLLFRGVDYRGGKLRPLMKANDC